MRKEQKLKKGRRFGEFWPFQSEVTGETITRVAGLYEERAGKARPLHTHTCTTSILLIQIVRSKRGH